MRYLGLQNWLNGSIASVKKLGCSQPRALLWLAVPGSILLMLAGRHRFLSQTVEDSTVRSTGLAAQIVGIVTALLGALLFTACIVCLSTKRR